MSNVLEWLLNLNQNATNLIEEPAQDNDLGRLLDFQEPSKEAVNIVPTPKIKIERPIVPSSQIKIERQSSEEESCSGASSDPSSSESGDEDSIEIDESADRVSISESESEDDSSTSSDNESASEEDNREFNGGIFTILFEIIN